MSSGSQLHDTLLQIAEMFERIDEGVQLRANHQGHLSNKGSQVSFILQLLSKNLPVNQTLKDYVHKENIAQYVECWVRLFQISNAARQTNQFASDFGPFQQERYTNALQFVLQRLEDVDHVMASVTSKMVDAGDCVKKIVHKDTVADSAVKECKVFNYLVEWVAVDVEGCFKKLDLARDRMRACAPKKGFPFVKLILFASGLLGFLASTALRNNLAYPNLLFLFSSVVLVSVPVYHFLTAGKRAPRQFLPIETPQIIENILTLLRNLK